MKFGISRPPAAKPFFFFLDSRWKPENHQETHEELQNRYATNRARNNKGVEYEIGMEIDPGFPHDSVTVALHCPKSFPGSGLDMLICPLDLSYLVGLGLTPAPPSP